MHHHSEEMVPQAIELCHRGKGTEHGHTKDSDHTPHDLLLTLVAETQDTGIYDGVVRCVFYRREKNKAPGSTIAVAEVDGEPA